MSISEALGFQGAGDVYLRPWLSGGTMGKKVDTGNTTKLAIKPKNKQDFQISRRRDTAGQNLASVSKTQPTEISLTCETLNSSNLLYLFMGRAAAYSQTGGTVTAEATIAQLDGWVQLAKEEISGLVLKKGSTTLVLGTDYDVNLRMGMYRVRSTNTNAVIDGDPLTADYTAAAFTGQKIRGGVEPLVLVEITFDGINLVDKSACFLRIWQATLAPTGEFDLLKDGLNELQMGGQIIVPPGFNEPFAFYQR